MELEIEKVLQKPIKGKSNRKILGHLQKGHIEKLLRASGVHPHVIKHLKAGSFFDSLWSGIKSAANFVKDKVLPVATKVIPKAIGAYSAIKSGNPMGALSALGSGKRRVKGRGKTSGGVLSAGGKSAGAKRLMARRSAGTRGRSAWIDKVKAYQAKHKCTYREALIKCKGK